MSSFSNELLLRVIDYVQKKEVTDTAWRRELRKRGLYRNYIELSKNGVTVTAYG